MSQLSPEIRSRLRGEMLHLYPSVDRAVVILTDSGIPQDKVPLNSSANVLWASILMEAEKHGKTLELIETALEEYPSRSELKKILLEFHEDDLVSMDNLKENWRVVERLIESGELYGSIERSFDLLQQVNEYVQFLLKDIKKAYEEQIRSGVKLSSFKEEKELLLIQLRNTLTQFLNTKNFIHDPSFENNASKGSKGIVQQELEKIVGESPYKNDLVSNAWLVKGLETAKGVLLVKNMGRQMGIGTGFLLKGGYLLTANYIIPDEMTCKNIQLEKTVNSLNEGEESQGVEITLSLDPDAFFLSSKELAYTLVKVKEDEDLLLEEGSLEIEYYVDPIPGDPVSIIQHPHGEESQISYTDNMITDVREHALIYRASTFPGSGGAPLLNQDWKVVGMHLKKVLSPDNSTFLPNIKEGVSIEAVLKDVRKKIPRLEHRQYPFLIKPPLRAHIQDRVEGFREKKQLTKKKKGAKNIMDF